MTRLLRVELRRLFARRLTRWMALVLLLGVAAVGISIAATTSNDLPAAHRSAHRTYERFLQEQSLGRQQCVANTPADQADENCGSPLDLPPESSFYSDPRFSFHDHVRDLITTGVVVGSLVALLLSASVIGAEWEAGTFATLLTWEPRRARVALAKIATAVAGSVALVAVATALLVGVGAVVAALHGTFHTIIQDPERAPHFARQTWAMAARGAAVVALMAGVGAGLALLLRRTVAAVGAAIAYLIVGEGILGQLRHGDLRHHLLQSRLDALLNGTYSWQLPIRGPDGSIGFSPDHQVVVHALRAGVQVTAIVLILLVVATLALQRRDVT